MTQVFGQTVYDASQNFGTDISYSATNDVLLASDADRSQQRVLRRLLTNPGDYIWHADYGAGLPKYVGDPLSATAFDQIKSTIISQMFLEDSVAKNPAPVITLQVTQFGLYVEIQYTINPLQQPVVLTFTVST